MYSWVEAWLLLLYLWSCCLFKPNDRRSQKNVFVDSLKPHKNSKRMLRSFKFIAITVYGVWLMADGWWLMAYGLSLFVNSNRKKRFIIEAAARNQLLVESDKNKFHSHSCLARSLPCKQSYSKFGNEVESHQLSPIFDPFDTFSQ